MQHTRRMRGVVKGVHEAYDEPSEADVEVEMPPTAADRERHGPMHGEKVHGRSHSHRMPKDVSGHFGIGDAVEVEQTIRHFGRRRHGQADAGDRDADAARSAKD